MADPVLYQRDGRIGRITLNRPEKMNAIDDALPGALEAAVEEADADDRVHVIVLRGAGPGFCGGYDLERYAEEPRPTRGSQDMPWDPIEDYRWMAAATASFMSLWRALTPSICAVHGAAVAGGSDIALCADLVVMAEDGRIGYPPARVWGCPTTAMWTYRIGAERAKRMLLTGDLIDGREAAEIGLVLEAVPAERLEERVEQLAHRIATVPRNQLAFQKLVVNQAVEQLGLASTQRLATFFDGMTRHTPEGVAFKATAEQHGWKHAIRERDLRGDSALGG